MTGPCEKTDTPLSFVAVQADTADTLHGIRAYVHTLRQRGGGGVSITGAPLRSLRTDEIDRLVAQGNSAHDWQDIRVAEGFVPDCVVANRFIGPCVLGVFDAAGIATPVKGQPPGVWHSVIGESEIGDNACVVQCRYMWGITVWPEALVYDVGELICTGQTRFGNGIAIPIGPESGERTIRICIDMGFADALQWVQTPAGHQAYDACERAMSGYIDQVQATRGIVGRHSCVRHTRRIRDCFIGTHVRVEGATLLQRCAVEGTGQAPARIADGAVVSDTCVQPGASITDMAHVRRSLLCGGSHAARHAKVSDSVIAAATGVEEGEMTSSLVGPAVGFHHQALCIAVVWPGGKGNIGHGANVGSNHTGRCADQHLRAGDGLFFGLGVNIKYPADFSAAHYTIIASGVDTLPQKMAFPFSLIKKPDKTYEGVAATYNELVPAWMLIDNVYSIVRSEQKLRTRLEGGDDVASPVFTPQVVQDMCRAVVRLDEAPADREVLSDRDLDGAGKNIVRSAWISRAQEAYERFVFHAVLLQWYRRLDALDAAQQRAVSVSRLTETWEALMQVYAHTPVPARIRALCDCTPQQRLWRLVDYDAILLEAARRSRGKDYTRGGEVFDDYAQMYRPLSEDALLRQRAQEHAHRKETVNRMMDRIA